MIIPTNWAQLNAIHTGAGVPTGAEYTIGLNHNSSGFDPTQVAQAWESIVLASNLYDNVANDVNMTSVLVKFGPNATGASALEPANEPGSGGTVGAAAPAFLIHKNTADGGRAGRGRMFIPGVPEAACGPGGVLVGGVVTAINAALSDILADMDAAGLPLYLLHGAGSPISTPSPIVSLTCDTTVATQRRRQRR